MHLSSTTPTLPHLLLKGTVLRDHFELTFFINNILLVSPGIDPGFSSSSLNPKLCCKLLRTANLSVK
jgi:hypothetical protein